VHALEERFVAPFPIAVAARSTATTKVPVSSELTANLCRWLQGACGGADAGARVRSICIEGTERIQTHIKRVSCNASHRMESS